MRFLLEGLVARSLATKTPQTSTQVIAEKIQRASNFTATQRRIKHNCEKPRKTPAERESIQDKQKKILKSFKLSNNL